jgi:hypothetical protein
MLPKTHIIFGLIFSAIILIIFPNISLTGFFILWISTFLIDFDHYLFYAWLKKDFNPHNSFKWFMKKHKEYLILSEEEKKNKIQIPCIFHGVEAIGFLLIMYLIFKLDIFLLIIIGFIFHESLDLISIIYIKGNFNHIISQTKNIINYKKKLKNGR